MMYLGGKDRIGDAVAAFLQPYVDAAKGYWEPFVGGLSVMSRVKHPNRIGSDLHPVINTYVMAQLGWEPPEVVTEEDYQRAKMLPDTDPIKHFIGFGCSFAGKYFGGMARYPKLDRNYARGAKRSLTRKMCGCAGVMFVQGSFDSLPLPEGYVIYCDPPYALTTGYSTGNFDHHKFWLWAAKASETNTVFVSEYTSPLGWEPVWSKERGLEMDSPSQNRRMEYIFQRRNT